MKKTKTILLTLILSILMVSTVAAEPRLNPDQVATQQDNGQFSNADLKEKASNLLSFLTALSFLEGPDRVVQGNNADFNIGLDLIENSKTLNSKMVWTVYDCGDTDCSNPPENDVNGDGVLDSCSLEDDVATGKDDCIAKAEFDINRIIEGDILGTGSTYEASVSYFVESNEDPGLYVAEAFIWNTDKGIVSDSPEKQFLVERDIVDDGTNGGNSDSDGDGVVDSEDNCKYTYGTGSSGCPVESTDDSDGDGTVNNQDACPTKPGPSTNDGCPVSPPSIPVIPIVTGIIIVVLGGVYYLYG